MHIDLLTARSSSSQLKMSFNSNGDQSPVRTDVFRDVNVPLFSFSPIFSYSEGDVVRGTSSGYPLIS